MRPARQTATEDELLARVDHWQQTAGDLAGKLATAERRIIDLERKVAELQSWAEYSDAQKARLYEENVELRQQLARKETP